MQSDKATCMLNWECWRANCVVSFNHKKCNFWNFLTYVAGKWFVWICCKFFSCKSKKYHSSLTASRLISWSCFFNLLIDCSSFLIHQVDIVLNQIINFSSMGRFNLERSVYMKKSIDEKSLESCLIRHLLRWDVVTYFWAALYLRILQLVTLDKKSPFSLFSLSLHYFHMLHFIFCIHISKDRRGSIIGGHTFRKLPYFVPSKPQTAFVFF